MQENDEIKDEKIENKNTDKSEKVENNENVAANEGEKKIELSEEELFIQALEKVRTESKENLDKFMRLSAEFVNYKNRVEREKLELIKYSGKEIMKELLPFIDTFDSALNAEHKDLDECIKGFELVHKSLIDILKKEGLEKINIEGEKFNPELHEAVGFDNIADLDDNVITFELQAGYKLKDKVLRHAMVKVNKK